MESRKKSLMFRPQEMNGEFKLKNNPIGHYHYHIRSHTDKHFLRVGGYLHYLADHAPLAVNKKWKKVFRKFCKLHPKF